MAKQVDLKTKFLFSRFQLRVRLAGAFILANLMLLPAQAEEPAVAKADQSPVLSATPVAPVLKAPGKIVVGVISGESRTEFETKYNSFFKEQWSNCPNCELRNLSVYDDKGNLNEKALASQLEALAGETSLLFFNVNWRYKADEHKPLVDLLKKISEHEVVIGSAGYPRSGESSAPLSRTVLTQVAGLIVIGEINERERLLADSFFGPEMLTAIKPPRDYVGKGLGPAFFVAKLAQSYPRRLPQDWLTHFRNQKMKSRRIWPQVEEFFSR